MGEIDLALQPINGYLISIIRNTVDGWYELEIGLPASWVFDENEKISCEILVEEDAGKIIKIAPKKTNILIDDLIKFVGIIIQTNEKIAEKEKEFTDKMEDMKKRLELEAKKFYEELDDLKESSFKKISEKTTKTPAKPKKTTERPKRNKINKLPVDKPIELLNN